MCQIIEVKESQSPPGLKRKVPRLLGLAINTDVASVKVQVKPKSLEIACSCLNHTMTCDGDKSLQVCK